MLEGHCRICIKEWLEHCLSDYKRHFQPAGHLVSQWPQGLVPQHFIDWGPLSMAVSMRQLAGAQWKNALQKLPFCLQEGGNSTTGLPAPSQPAAGAGSLGQQQAQQQTSSAGPVAGEGDIAACCIHKPASCGSETQT